MKEEWRDIEGYEGFYQVSSQGRVRSLDRVVGASNGGRRFWKGCLMKQSNNTYGYTRIGLTKESKVRYFMVHRLVAAAFIANPDGKPQVNHINEIKDDNRLENLEWATIKENANHSIVTIKGKRLRTSTVKNKRGPLDPDWVRYMAKIKRLVPQLKYGKTKIVCAHFSKSEAYLRSVRSGAYYDTGLLKQIVEVLEQHIEEGKDTPARTY